MERLAAIADRELRKTLLYVRAVGRPVTAGQVAAALAAPRTAARWRLEKLLNAGLLVSGFERPRGRSGPGAGRPAKTYAPAPDVQPIEFPRRRYETLVALLIAALPARGRADELSRIGVEFGRELARAARLRRARALPAALERLCKGLGALGFHASLESVSEKGAVIVSAGCPLRPLVLVDESVRRIDEGMWRGLVDAATRERSSAVSCRTAGCLDRERPCRVVITFATP